MKHFSYLSDTDRQQIFFFEPIEFSKKMKKELLAYALGATLYMPGTRTQIAKDVLSGRHEGLTSMVICLEDSIGDNEVEAAVINVVAQLQEISRAVLFQLFEPGDVPLIFIRIRESRQMVDLVEQLGEAVSVLSGFVFPKFTPSNGMDFLETLQRLNESMKTTFYGMPILESAEIIYRETRVDSLIQIKALLDQFYDVILNVRIGATDFSGLFGIRRSNDTTIYDIAIIRDCVSDIINVLGRSEKHYVISGPVWEYFYGSERILKPQIRQTPFQKAFGRHGLKLRNEMINRLEDGLIHEVLLDKTNGLVGKTIIHPSHIKTVQSLNVVTFEEYTDAHSIIESSNLLKGAFKSTFANKMNEVKPHYNWAKKILLKSKIYGVFHEQQSFIELINERHEKHVHI